MPEAATTEETETVVPVLERTGLPLWAKGVLPLLLLVVLVAGFLKLGPVGVFRKAFPPVEELTVQRITLPAPYRMEVSVVNGGPEPVTIAQVMVDDANWVFGINGPARVDRLESRVITIPYPWVEGEPHHVKLVTSTGLTFEGEVAVATQTPTADARYLGTFALLGVYAGVIPVLLGLLWFPFLRQVDRRWVDFFLALTIGLLGFIGVEALVEAVETSDLVPGAFQGTGLVLIGVVTAPLLLAALGHWRGTARGSRPGFYVALLIAIGIGLHNLGEGLAIGTSYATGEIALGTSLLVGFLLHNTTEGLGIISPLTNERPGIWRLLLLGAIAGVPTVLGSWIGGFSYSPIWTTLFFALGAGAIVQVIYELFRLFARRGGAALLAPLNVAGLMVGVMIMYVTGLLVVG
jgi:ZIP family zinc transporter